jgi:hypothetical protein
MNDLLLRLRDKGNTVTGHDGDQIVFEGTPVDPRPRRPRTTGEGMPISSGIMRQNSGCKGKRGLRASGRGYEVDELSP